MQILIVDDNEMVRRGVSALLSSRPTWQVCGYAGDGKEALRKAKELRPDIILLDISMPGANGLDVARILRREMPKTKIVIMSQHDPIQVLPRVLEAGAHACVDKNSLHTDLLPTIETLGKTMDARRGANAG
jgi:two-component system, NarL family, response regulator NreC